MALGSAVRNVVIRIAGDATGLDRTLRHASKQSGKFGLDIGKVGKLAGAGLAAGAAAAGAFAVSAVKAAMDDAQAQAILANTLKKTTGAHKQQIAAVEDWISKTTLATGVADDDLRPALGTLLGVTHDATKAQKLLSTAMDVSAATGKPLTTVTTAIARAANGATDGLGRWGVNMKDANGKAVPFTEAMKRLNDQFGGSQQAKTQSMAGQVQVLKNRFNETKESIGGALLPMLTKLFQWINATAIPALGRFSAWFSQHVLPVIKQVAAWFAGKFRDAIEQWRAALQRNRPQIEQLLTALKQVGGWLVRNLLPVIKTFWNYYLKFLIQYIANTIDLIGRWVDAIKTVGRVAERVGGAIAAPFIAAFDMIKSAWNNTLGRIHISIPDWAVGVPGRGQTWSVPQLARGGIIKARPGGTLVLAGEAGRDEAIVPLPARGATGAGSGSIVMDFRGAIIGRGAKDEIIQAVKEYVRTRGNGDVTVLAGAR